jgi:hypothetical protein
MNDITSSDNEDTEDKSDDQKALSSRGDGGPLAGTLFPQAVANLEKKENKKRPQDSTEDLPAKRVAGRRTTKK